MEKFKLINKVAVITGGSSGIGKSIALNFIESGAKTFVLDINKINNEDFKLDSAKNKNNLHFIKCDVSKYSEVKYCFSKILKLNNIDILVNSAGIAHIGNIELVTEKDMDMIYNVNIKGIFNCIKSSIKNMKTQKSGVIINIASVASSLGIFDRFAYSMSKGAVLTMTYSIAKDYLKYNIRCNSISPARVHTKFVDDFIKKNYKGREKEIFKKLSSSQPIGRMAKPEEIANLALFLASNESSFITGSNYTIDGGFTKLNGN